MNELPEHPLVPRLRVAIGCPIFWEDHFSDIQLCKDLRLNWVKLAEGFQADNEMWFYSRWHLDMHLDESELKCIEANAAYWRDAAVEEYLKKVGFLRYIHFAPPTVYAKHFPPAGMTKEEIIAKTENSTSLFYSADCIAELDSLLWLCIQDSLLRVIDTRPEHLFAKTQSPTGASEGKPANVIRFDLNYDKPDAHGHPRIKLPADAYIVDEEKFPSRAYSSDEYDFWDNDIDEPRFKNRIAWL